MAKSKKQSTQNVENVSGRVIQAGGNVTVNEKSSKTVALQIHNRVLGENHPTTKAVLSWLEHAREQAKQASSK